jgi:HAD superfamily hydrolase (TIGR01509 family)
MRRSRRARAGSPCAVIFDLDGTLLDSEPVYRAAFAAALAAFGRGLDARLYARLIGVATPDRIPLLAAAFGSAFPMAAFLSEYYRQKTRRVQHGIPLKPGAVVLLEWLRHRGVPVAIATSSTSATARSNLARAGLHDRFAAVLTRDQVGRQKPFPDLFVEAAAALDVPPDACLALEDSGHGALAAHRAGMISVLVPDLAAVPAHAQARTLADLHAVRAMLAEN